MSGTRASRYVVRGKLGEGGMAEVLEAVAHGDAGFTRRVAIKRLLARYTDPSFARMFLDEARIAAGLHHSGIVGVLDYGVMDGAPFQILEFIDGENAKELFARGTQSKKAMPIEVALFLVAEVARALHYAHGHTDDAGVLRGVVHRDVKPANILVSRAGDVKLTDFGIAFARDRSEQTEVGVAKGTPGYMAPEQIVGGSVDARTDIFALGCTLHALVTSESPLATPGNLERLLRRDPLELSSDVPEDVARIIRRATAAVPSARYPTAAAMADDVGVLASHLRADPKGALIKWLESLQPVKPAAPSPFDALLMPEAVLERGDANDSWHLEMTKADASALAPTIENHEAKRSDSRRSLSGARGAGLRVALAVALTVGVLGVGAYVVRAERHGQAAAATPPPPPTNAAAAPSASTTAVPEPEAVSTPSEPETGRAVIAPRGRLAESAQIPPTNLLGTVAVRGGSHRGASIAIDGKVTPFGAPHYFDLPVGKHVIELRVDGGVTATGMVNVLPEHTPTAPVYWP